MDADFRAMLAADFMEKATMYIAIMDRLRVLPAEIRESGDRIRELTLQIEREAGVRSRSTRWPKNGDAGASDGG